MGQIALGFRSLLVKLAIFFVMASLLAWALGGTLFPRPETAIVNAIRFDGEEWAWRLSVGGREKGTVRWHLVRLLDGDVVVADEHAYAEVAGPITDGEALFYAGRGGTDRQWTLASIDRNRERAFHPLIDRLSVERQFARLESGLPIQDPATEHEVRDLVLDPPIARGAASTGDGSGN